jgi:hypothetical protein
MICDDLWGFIGCNYQNDKDVIDKWRFKQEE